jgi:hypothetical protein
MSLRTCLSTAVRGTALARTPVGARPAARATPVVRQRLGQPSFRRFVSDDGSNKAASAARDRAAVGVSYLHRAIPSADVLDFYMEGR